jgi:hypothetical protein
MTDHVTNRNASNDAAEHSGQEGQVAAYFCGKSIRARAMKHHVEWISGVPARQTDLS